MALGNEKAWAPRAVPPTLLGLLSMSSKLRMPEFCQKAQTSVSLAMLPIQTNLLGSIYAPRRPRMESSMLLERILANSVPSLAALV